MTLVVSSVAVLMGLGLVFGLGLAWASRKFAVKVDPKVEALEEALPGVNCGACGYVGCPAYAEAVVAGEAAPDLCVPGGPETAAQVADIMGLELGEGKAAVQAFLFCQGGRAQAERNFDYVGIETCAAADLLQTGGLACRYGCLGFGDCVRVCAFDGLRLGEDGLPRVDRDVCTGCGLCAKACPRDLFHVLPADVPAYVGCSSRGRGAAVKKICKVGCIACGLCEKVTSSGAIAMADNLPVLDYGKDEDFLAAVEKCPMNCFVVLQEAAVASS